MIALHAAMGAPPLEGFVPQGRSPTWREGAAVLARTLRASGRNLRLRSWTSLWMLLKNETPPKSAKWGQLLANATMQDLIDAVDRGRKDGKVAITTWNARWLVRSTTTNSKYKKAMIGNCLSKGRIVCVQETHWGQSAKLLWENLFPATQVIAATARKGPAGGPQGGVAIILPPGIRSESHNIIAEGIAVEAIFKPPQAKQEIRVVSMYLPPDSRLEDARTIQRQIRPFEGDTYFAGDFNIDLEEPRGSHENEIMKVINDIFGANSSILLPGHEKTRLGRKSDARLDGIGVPRGAAWAWGTRSYASPWMSDHAVLTASPTSQTRGDRPCTAQTIKGLPSEATSDLRARYLQLELIFRVPHRVYRPESPTEPLCQEGILPYDALGNAVLREGKKSENLPNIGNDDYRDDQPVQDRKEGNAATQSSQSKEGTGNDKESIDPCRPNGALAQYGGQILRGMLRHWWNSWKNKGPSDRSIGNELKNAIKGRSRPPSRALRRWLVARGGDEQDIDLIEPEAAIRWNAVYENEMQNARAAKAQARLRQAEVSRAPLQCRYKVGRALYKGRSAVNAIVDEKGHRHTRPEGIAKALWNSRKDLWESVPPLPATAIHILKEYGRDKDSGLPPTPKPSLDKIAGSILSAGNSAAGVDGWPYEVFHYGVGFTANLICTAILVGQTDTGTLHRLLGPNIDLLLWIPKKEDVEATDGQRPLQLPSTLRRLYGSSLMEMVGPTVEPRLGSCQAARRGGTTGRNIAIAMDHLLGDRSRDDTADREDLGKEWWSVMGQMASHVDGATEVDGGDSLGRAVILADQSKAFERLGYLWIILVMKTWKFPKWAYNGFIALVMGREVCARIGGTVSRPRALARGLGMGGPHSPFLWSLSFDPITDTLSKGVKAETPTYVDDLSALANNPRHSTRTMVMLMATAKMAGLHTDTHACESILLQGRPPCVQAVGKILPIEVEETPKGDTRVGGMPGGFLSKLFGSILGTRPRVMTASCRCKVKTILVPASNVEGWRRCMTAAAYGATMVKESGTLLGVTIATPYGRKRDRATPTGTFIRKVRADTHNTATKRIVHRMEVMEKGGASPNIKAEVWNTYMAPCLPYPSQLCLPTLDATKKVVKAYREFHGTEGWAPWSLPAALSVLFGVRGAPKCPVTTATASNLLAWIAGQLWGPVCLSPGIPELWHRVREWAEGRLEGECQPGGITKSCLRAIRGLAANPTDHNTRKHAGPALYSAVLYLAVGEQISDWLIEKSRHRSWWPTEGGEWKVVHRASSYASALYTIKLLSGGIKGTVARRARESRSYRHRTCELCNSQEVLWTWTTPAPGQAGHSWCGQCIGRVDHGIAPWAWLLAKKGIKDSRAPETRIPDALDRTEWHMSQSPYLTCPLCGMGEASSQHLAIWCPAVGIAWKVIAPRAGEHTVMEAAVNGRQPESVIALCHQVVVHYGAWATRHQADYKKAAGDMIQAVKCGQPALNPELDLEEEEGLGRPHQLKRQGLLAREPLAPCDRCRRVRSLMHGSSRPYLQGGSDRPTKTAKLYPVASRAVHERDTILVTYAESHPAHWLPVGKGWIPQPDVSTKEANASWCRGTCPRCRSHRLYIKADRDIPKGQEIKVAPSRLVYHPGTDRDMEVTFDGGAREVRGRRVAGAAAVLWLPDPLGGEMVPTCAVHILLPGEEHAQVAEAWGLRGAVGLALYGTKGTTGNRITGDNLAVIRYAADQGGLRKIALQALLEVPLARLAATGRKIEWLAVRRRFNKAADREATEALMAARERADRTTRHEVRIVPMEYHPNRDQLVEHLLGIDRW